MYLKKSGRPALQVALFNCGITDSKPETLKQSLGDLFALQRDTYVYHELGELGDTVFPVILWREIVGQFPQTAIELLVRSVKDLLADTCSHGPLCHMRRNKKVTALGFYVAFIDGMMKLLFPEIRTAFERFVINHCWEEIDRAVASGYERAKKYTLLITDIFKKGKDGANLPDTQQKLEALVPENEADLI